MKKIYACILALSLAVTGMADEGMWMLKDLKEGNWNRMKELGFTLTKEQLYDEVHPSLKDAVVYFDRGCTGITVSGRGLIFTNHHCGYNAIQSQSSLEHDYLKDGFIARTPDEEIPIPGMIVRYLVRTENVTAQLLDSVKNITNEEDRLNKIQDICKAIEDSLTDNSKFISAEVSSAFSENAYYLNVYEIYSDIRMVFAPPSSVGKFGGDTDNWMWPRHTGDFSIFRVYADKENKPAEFNAANSPYRPKSFAPVTLDGYKENDYSMTIGYPGSTDRYLSSWGIEQRVNCTNTPRIEVRGIKQEIWKEAMLASDEIRIKYASKYAGSSNYWKNSIGMNRGIKRMHVIERKKALENQFTEWINQDEERKAFYGDALNLIQDAYVSTNEMQLALTYLYESLVAGTELTRLTTRVMAYDITDTPENRASYLEKELRPAYKNYDPELDQKVLAAMLKIAGERTPEVFLPQIYKDIRKKYKGDYEKYARDVFRKSVVPHIDQLEKVLTDPKKVKKLDKDPAYQLTKSIQEAFRATIMGVGSFDSDRSKGERLFFAGLQQMMPEKIWPADANSTMRMSYGSIKSYIPFDGAWYSYFTTEKGIFEKYKKGDPEFDVQPEILELLRNKQNFKEYADDNGNLNLCFLSDNDITGGNSGSPVFDAKGRVTGLAFDGNWEAMSGDIVFEPEVQRTISVDIRYVIFMIDKWGKCNWLLEELGIKKAE